MIIARNHLATAAFFPYIPAVHVHSFTHGPSPHPPRSTLFPCHVVKTRRSAKILSSVHHTPTTTTTTTMPATLLLLALLALTNAQQFPAFTEEGCLSLPVLVCNVMPTDGFSTEGDVYFAPVWRRRGPDSDKFTCFTRITAAIAGLTGSAHGFHVHTYGDLSTADGTSTGGHFTDPAGSEIPHGLPNDEERHWGDFGSLEVDPSSGIAEYDRVDNVIRLGAVLGRAITIHEGQDQGSAEQPSGNSGSRVGFCVIGYSNPEVRAAV